MTAPPSSPWFVCRKPNLGARLRLFCFPHAGGGASAFRAWADELPSSIEVCAVQLPGRESRLREPPFARLEPLVRELAGAIEPHLSKPAAFFGYSLGVLVAFELARLLRRRQAPPLVHLFVAARAAPHLPGTEPALHTCSDPELIAEVRRRYDGIPQAVLQEPELMQLLLPVLRADLAAMETYTCALEDPLACPLSAIGGRDDHAVAPDAIEAWRTQTSGQFTFRLLPGGHFFLNTQRTLLLKAVSDDLGAG